MMHMDKLHLERAFTEAPSELRDCVEEAFERGAKEMKRRHKWMTALSVAAACAVIFAGLAMAAGQLTRPRPDTVLTDRGDSPQATSRPTTKATPIPDITPEPTSTPEVIPEPTPTPEVTPEPTPTPEVTPEPEVSLVYTQPASNYYHMDPGCSGMVGAVPWTEESAISVGKQPCPVCILGTATLDLEEAPEEASAAESVEAPVYYTEAGRYYHGNEHCSGMLNTQPHSIELALASGKERCPVCQPIEPDHYDLFRAAFGQDLEALTPGYAYGYCGDDSDFFGEDSWFVTDGETYSMVCHVENILKADGGVNSITSYLGNPLEDVFCISFYSKNIGKDNLWSFLSGTEVGATAFREKDEAVERAVDRAGFEEPLNLEEGNVWVAIDSGGVIKELELYYVDTFSDVTVTLAWTLTDGQYVFMGTVE